MSQARQVLACTFAALVTSGCGGGGSGGGFFTPVASAPPPAPASGPAPAPAPPPVATTVSGVVASGAAFAGAHLTVVDAAGATVCDTTVSASGTYGCTLAPETKAPLVITALRDDDVLYSVSASAADGRINVTPVTTIIASMLSPNGNPAQLAAALQATPEMASAAQIQTRVSAVLALLKPLLDALGDATDPITGVFAADGTGYDRVLDAMAVSVRPDGTAANIEVTVRTIPATADAPPVAVSFRSTEANPPALPAIAAGLLPPAGISVQVDDLFARLTNCFALPLSQRVNAPNETAAVTGGAADVKAPACRSLFVGSDPASYLQGGLRVGRDAAGAGAFTGLFRPLSTGLVFDQGALAYYLPNGDLAVTARILDTAGNVSPALYVARSVAGALQLIGDQNAYGVTVRPSVQEREYLNSPAFTFYNTGYDVTIPDVLDGQGRSIFKSATVTLPSGSSVSFIPAPGYNSLRVQRPNGTATGTTILRMGAAFRDPATAGSPAAKEPDLFPLPLISDAEIGAQPDQGVWKIRYAFADTTQPDVVQTTRTIVRAYTLAETAQVLFPQLTEPMRATLVNLSSSTGSITFLSDPGGSFLNVISFHAPGGGDAWSVPAGATLPSQVTAFGTGVAVNGVPGVAFNDGAALGSAQRSATIYCAKASAADTHCDPVTGLYLKGDYFTFLQLSGTNLKQVESFKGWALYRLQ